MTAKIPPSAATPSPIHIHVSLDMARNLVRSATHRYPPRGPLTMKVLCCLLLASVACASAQRAIPAAKTAAIECGKEYAAPAVSTLAQWAAELAITGKVNWAAIEAGAKALGREVGSCLVAEFLGALKKQPTAEARSLLAEAPDDIAQGEAVLSRVSGGAEVVLQ